MWRIVKQSDRETMIDELQRLKPLSDEGDQSQRQRTVSFVINELQAFGQENASINLSGSKTNGDNYLSVIVGPKGLQGGWHLNKTNLPTGLKRAQLITYLTGLPAESEQQSRAVAFALAELNASTEVSGSVSMSGDPIKGYLSVSVSAAE